MDTTTTLLLVAIIAMWISLNCGLVLVYLLWSGQSLWPPGGMGKSRRASVPAGAGTVAREASQAPVLVDEQSGAWGLLVVFDSPSAGLNLNIGNVLAAAGAVFESETRSFTIAGVSPRNPILVANAYPPASLPSFNDHSSQWPIKGLSIRILKDRRSSSPNKLQLVRLVALARDLSRLGANVVDAQNQPITEAGFQAVIDGKAKF
ncbi:hypothetical protein SAMN04487957_102214 [Halomonas shengliensis]|uniref:Cell division protein ZipA n=1 Tax=Halomonas shengliensis TaxID=419597 RepID=A0A1H0EVN0_9GAMM|nr:hypothetical protein [Halomonas shengliensis]SDN86487.1 hypothetical protein SAMN04487957_102214 [Halomonas shengliensis]